MYKLYTVYVHTDWYTKNIHRLSVQIQGYTYILYCYQVFICGNTGVRMRFILHSGLSLYKERNTHRLYTLYVEIYWYT
jgi:hypothetical protein